MGVTLNSLGIFQKNNQFNHCQPFIQKPVPLIVTNEKERKEEPNHVQ